METKQSKSTSAQRNLGLLCAAGLTGALLTGACGDDDDQKKDYAQPEESLQGLIGPDGGVLVGAEGSAFEGVKLSIPPGALAEETMIEITEATSSTPLPATAVRCGEEFALAPAGLKLAVPATLTLPFDEAAVSEQFRFADEVKIWALEGEQWGRREQLESESGLVSVSLEALTTAAAGVNPPAEQDLVYFQFAPASATLLPCFAQYPDDPNRQPTMEAFVVRGEENDGMFLRGKNFKPGIEFDLFSLENSLLGADGAFNPNFKGFGLAWYQSDLHANDRGSIKTVIRTVLLDQIFGLDSSVALGPTNTFNLGFWFNDPQAAVSCGFNAEKPTPFNGEHAAGPLAMSTLPNAETGLGPLCTKPNTSVSPAKCDP